MARMTNLPTAIEAAIPARMTVLTVEMKQPVSTLQPEVDPQPWTQHRPGQDQMNVEPVRMICAV